MHMRPLGLFAAFILTSRCLTAQASRAPAAAGRPDRGVIRGVVLDTLDRLVVGAHVYVFADSVVPSLSEGGRVRFSWLVASGDSDNRGRFEFDVPNSHAYTVRTFGPPIEAELNSVVPATSDSGTVRLLMNRPVAPGSRAATRSRQLAQLAKAESRWAARAVKSYQLRARLDCLCNAASDSAPTLEFRGDSLVGRIDRNGRVMAGSVKEWWRAFSVVSLFAAAESEIRDYRRVVFSIVYDPSYGFPSLISTDNSQRMPDLWLRYWADNFRVVRR